MILYLDTNVLVYSIAASAKFRDPARRWLDWHGQQPGALLVTSRLTVLEALVGPIKRSDAVRLRRTEDALDSLLILDMDDVVVRRAAQIRATYPFRTPDALHLATAAEAQADIYLTADRRLKSFKAVRIADVLRDRPGATRRASS
jgi:predicted nucleic acid-binding protein